MIELNGQPAELRFTLHITRAETGETETYEMVGHTIDESEIEQSVIEQLTEE